MLMQRVLRSSLVLAFLAAPAPPATAALSSIPDRTFVTDGHVYAVARSADRIYIGGQFTQVGPRTGPGVGFAADGSQDLGWPEVAGGEGFVNAVVADGSGGWYIGGGFTHVGAVARSNIAHIRPDRTVDPGFDPAANGSVHTLLLSGSTLYAGGRFTSIGGQARNHIAALDVADGSATSFDPDANGFGVFALALSGSTLYAAGSFTTIGGQPRNNIAALHFADGTATGFNPNADLFVNALAMSGSIVYAGGGFTSIGGQPRNFIAALDTADGSATSFNPDADRDVFSLALSGSILYVGGNFSTIGGQTRNLIAALDVADGTATGFNPNAYAFDPFERGVYALAVSGSTVYAGGWFTSIGGQARNYIAALNAASGSATSFNPNANAYCRAIALSGGTLYAGGSFTSIGGQPRNNIAALDAADGTLTSFDPHADLNVRTLLVSGSTLYVGGGFTFIGGQPRNRIAALNTADGSATSFNPNANDYVLALALADSTLYAGGLFTVIGGQPRLRIAALHTGGGILEGTATSFNPIADAVVWALALSGSTLYAGGNFTLIGLQPRNHIAALDVADGTATSFNPNADAVVLALAASGSTLYAGGQFAVIGGQQRNHIAAIDVADGSATSFDPDPDGTTFDSSVFALAVSGSTVYAGGGFTSIGGQPRKYLAALDAADGTATSFDPDPSDFIRALALAPDGTLYAGGLFRGFDRAAQQGFASFSEAPTTSTPISSGGPIPDLALLPVAPNPTSGRVRIEFAMPREAPVRISILDVQGREVAVIADGVYRPGRYQLVWSGERQRGGTAPAGVYFVCYRVPGQRLSQRVVLTR